jgi:hypothetical protein
MRKYNITMVEKKEDQCGGGLGKVGVAVAV